MPNWPEIAGSGGLVGLLLVVLIVYRKPILDTISGRGRDPYVEEISKICSSIERIAKSVEGLHGDIHEELIRRQAFRSIKGDN